MMRRCGNLCGMLPFVDPVLRLPFSRRRKWPRESQLLQAELALVGSPVTATIGRQLLLLLLPLLELYAPRLSSMKIATTSTSSSLEGPSRGLERTAGILMEAELDELTSGWSVYVHIMLYRSPAVMGCSVQLAIGTNTDVRTYNQGEV